MFIYIYILFQLKDKTGPEKRCFPLVSEYNPHLQAVPPVLHRYKHILLMDSVVSAAIPQNSIFASYRQPKSIKDLLVHSKFVDRSGEPIASNSDIGCKSCNNCYFCKYYMIEDTSFKSFECNTTFNINQLITCEDEGVIYLIFDNLCGRTYTGSTIDCMKFRMSNYKNHIKTAHPGCEMAQHFAERSDIHSLYSDSKANTRTRAFQNKFDDHLSGQIKVILIEKVDLSSCTTTKQKRDLIEQREGYWQTQVRSLSRYGGLNKRDDRKRVNNRQATRKAIVTSTKQAAPCLDGSESSSVPEQECQKVAAAPTHTEAVEDPSPPLRRSSRLRNKN